MGKSGSNTRSRPDQVSAVSGTVRRKDELRCPWCHDAVQGSDKKWACFECMAWHHSVCHDEHKRCASCGAREPKPAASPRQPDRASPPRTAARPSPTTAPAPAMVFKGCKTIGCRQPALDRADLDQTVSLHCVGHAYEHALGLGCLGWCFGAASGVATLFFVGWALVELEPARLGGLFLTLPFFGVGAWMIASKRAYDRIAAELKRTGRQR